MARVTLRRKLISRGIIWRYCAPWGWFTCRFKQGCVEPLVPQDSNALEDEMG